MAVYRGVVTRVTTTSVWVRVPDLAGGRFEFGPFDRPSGAPLELGQRVVVGSAGDVRDDLVVIAGQGTKNGLAPASVYLKPSTGAPATGTWAVNDVVIDSAGKLWICTVAGTPGTWSTQTP